MRGAAAKVRAKLAPLHKEVCSCHDSSRGWRQPAGLAGGWLCSKGGFTLRWLLCRGPLARWGDAGQFCVL